MLRFRSLIAPFILTWMFSVTAFADQILTFQPTGFTLPSFQPTINGVPVGNPSYLANPATATTDPQFTLDSKNLSGMEGVSGFWNTLPTTPTTTEVDWVPKGSFSVSGLLSTSPGDPGIPVTLSGNITGTIIEYPGVSANASPGWAGSLGGSSLGGTVSSISGLPTPDTKNILGMIGNLSQFQFYLWVIDNTATPSVTGGGVTYYPDGSGVPEPGSLVVFAFLATGFGVYHAVRSRKPTKPAHRQER